MPRNDRAWRLLGAVGDLLIRCFKCCVLECCGPAHLVSISSTSPRKFLPGGRLSRLDWELCPRNSCVWSENLRVPTWNLHVRIEEAQIRLSNVRVPTAEARVRTRYPHVRSENIKTSTEYGQIPKALLMVRGANVQIRAPLPHIPGPKMELFADRERLRHQSVALEVLGRAPCTRRLGFVGFAGQ